MSSDKKRSPSIFSSWGLSCITGFSAGNAWKYLNMIGDTQKCWRCRDMVVVKDDHYYYRGGFLVTFFSVIMSLSGYRLYKQINFERNVIETRWSDSISDIVYTDDIKKDYFWMSLKIVLGAIVGYIGGTFDLTKLLK